MRLLVVTQYFWPENFRINDLVGELVGRGHEITVLTGLPNYPNGSLYPEFRADRSRFATHKGAKIVRVPLITRGSGGLRLVLNYLSFALSASLLGVWKLRRGKFDAILAYEPSPITVGLPALVLRWRKRLPFAFWVLDLWPETLQAVGVVRSTMALKAVGKLVSFIYRRCDLILAQSNSFIPQIRKYAGPAIRVCYFPNWAESVFQMNGVSAAPEIREREGCFNIMFAGNIGDAQDFPSILAAAEALKENRRIRWLIVGDGRAFQWVKNELTRRGLEHCVELLGRHPVERMPSFFKHADALLVSLKDEPIFSMTIPGKLQSYLAAGIPVMAMLNGEGADLVVKAGAGMSCAAGDWKGLASIVAKASEMTAGELARMGANGLAVSAAEFDRDALIGRLEGLLGGMVSDRARDKQ